MIQVHKRLKVIIIAISTGIPKRQLLLPLLSFLHSSMPYSKQNKRCTNSNRLLHLCDVQFYVRIHLQEFVVCVVNFVLDVLLQVGHLESVSEQLCR
jgi:hypothetical protein